jgi:hypothetical protein
MNGASVDDFVLITKLAKSSLREALSYIMLLYDM